MGFPDNYTNIENAKKTNRYQAIGNSLAVPVIKWIGLRIKNENYSSTLLSNYRSFVSGNYLVENLNDIYNCTEKPNNYHIGSLYSIIDANAPKDIYLSPVGCYGIIRRAYERNLSLNKWLEKILIETSKQLPKDEIEKKSSQQKRGKFSQLMSTEKKTKNYFSLLDL